MRTELVRDLMRYLDPDGSLKVGRCPNQAKRKLEDMSIPLQLKRLLQSCWANCGWQIADYTLHSVEEILSNEDAPKLIGSNMIPIGYALNGDPLVLCFSEEKCAVGLVSHDQFWEGVEPGTAYVEITGTVEEFLWRAAEGRYLPVDYYAASELVEMRNEMYRNGSA